jgi:hypothetical protein
MEHRIANVNVTRRHIGDCGLSPGYTGSLFLPHGGDCLQPAEVDEAHHEFKSSSSTKPKQIHLMLFVPIASVPDVCETNPVETYLNCARYDPSHLIVNVCRSNLTSCTSEMRRTGPAIKGRLTLCSLPGRPPILSVDVQNCSDTDRARREACH